MANRIFRNSRRPQNALIPFGPWQQGVNERSEPHLLEFSELSGAENIMVDENDGRILKRPGTLHRSDLPVLIDPPVRAYNFTKRDGTEYMLVTDNRKLIVSSDLVTWTDITPELFLSTNEFAGGGFVLDFETAEDKVWISNGADDVFSWDGVIAGTSTESLVAYDKGTSKVVWTTADIDDTQTSIKDPELVRAAGTTWKGQTVVCTNAVNTNNIGITRTVLTFDGTDKITFDAFPEAISDTDEFLIGVEIPRGRYLKYHHGTLFSASTSINGQEVRFSTQTDPNEPAILMGLDNPNAWDALSQLEIGSGQGDRIYGFSNPVYRDRIAVFKRRGIYRIDPDPTFEFVPVTITEQFGSRFPGSWQQHGDVLMFLGEDEDGLPDVYMTDFTTVRHFKRKHRKTLDLLKQPTSVLRSKSIATATEWNSGVIGDTADGDSGVLKAKSFTRPQLFSKLVNPVGMDLLTNADESKATILGHPKWDLIHNGDTDPEPNGWNHSRRDPNATPRIQFGGYHSALWLGSGFAPGSGTFYMRWTKELDTDVGTKDVFMRFGLIVNVNVAALLQGNHRGFGRIRNGTKQLEVSINAGDYVVVNGVQLALGGVRNTQNDVAMLLKSDGTGRVWINGVEQTIAPTTNTSSKNMEFGLEIDPTPFQFINWDSVSVSYDYVNYHEDFKASSQFTATLPTEGTADVVMDYKSDPYSFYKQWFSTLGASSPSLSMETASSADDITYSALQALGQGQVPGVDNSTPVARYLKTRMKITKTVPTQDDGEYLESYVGGLKYFTPLIQVGADIKAWDLFQIDESGLPSTSDLRIRVATDASLGGAPSPDATANTGWDTARAGSDADGWIAITNRANIGTVLLGSEGSPNPPFPEARFVQLRVEGGVDTIDEVHGVSSLIVNWLEGSPQFLPVASIMFQKKWLLSAANVNSTTNNTIVVVDTNRAFYNWGGLGVNFFTWFNGKIYVGGGTRKELLELTADLLHDDDGPAGGGGRNTKAISAYIETKQEIAGAIHARKKSRYLECAANIEDSIITFSFKRDVESIYTALATVTFSASLSHKRINFPIGKQFKRITFRAENNTLNQDFGLEGFVLQIEQVPSRSGL